MKSFFLFLILLTNSLVLFSQKPKDGIYTYKVAFAEWGGKSLGTTCTVIIKGNTVKVLHNGKKGLEGKKGDMIAKGIIMKHIKTGKWIIANSSKDKYAKEIGGCSDGPPVIDFKNKIFWLC